MVTFDKGFLIHIRKYKETSSIVSILSAKRGLYSLLFKGKETDKNKYNFSIFNEYQFSFNERYELPIMAKYELIKRFDFSTKYYLLGLYINELIYKTLKYNDDYIKIYNEYKDFLIQIKTSSFSSERLALIFEKKLLEYLGYGLFPESSTLLLDDAFYFYDSDVGFRKSEEKTSSVYNIPGKTLKLFLENIIIDNHHITSMRLITKNIFLKHYPDIQINGDNLF